MECHSLRIYRRNLREDKLGLGSYSIVQRSTGLEGQGSFDDLFPCFLGHGYFLLFPVIQGLSFSQGQISIGDFHLSSEHGASEDPRGWQLDGKANIIVALCHSSIEGLAGRRIAEDAEDVEDAKDVEDVEDVR